VETTREFVENSSAGFSASELENILNVEVKHTLFKLYQNRRLHREKMREIYIYFSSDKKAQKNQIALRKSNQLNFDIDLSYEVDTLSDELKAAIILFFTMLNEKQRRLYAGLESFKIGHGGDKRIADFLDLDVHTVAKGRRELFSGNVESSRIRKKGGGRKPVEKKSRKS
jgi:hypothetical protein